MNAFSISPTARRLAVCVSMMITQTHAASLKQASVTHVVNDVRIVAPQQTARTAGVGDKISGSMGVATGVQSRAELEFPDMTLTRLGANSVFRLDQAERTLNLDKGVIFLQVPKQIGGAKIRTAAVTAAVTGTSVLFEALPGGYVKIIVLEGEVDVFLTDNPKVFRTLHEGDMVIMKWDADSIPMAVQVDLERLRATSLLLDEKEFRPLINEKHLADALADQNKKKLDGELIKTAFVIPGRGTLVTLTNEARQDIFKNIAIRDAVAGNTPGGNGNNINGPGGGNAGANTTDGNNGGGNANTPGGTPGGGGSGFTPGSPIFHPGSTVLDNSASISTNPHLFAFNSLRDDFVTMVGTIYRPGIDGPYDRYINGDAQSFPQMDEFLSSHGNWFVFKGQDLYIAGDIPVNSSGGPRNVILAARDSVTLSYNEADSLFGGGVLSDSVDETGGFNFSTVWNLPSSLDALAITARNGSMTMDSSFSILGTTQDVVFYASGPNSDISIAGDYESINPSINLPDGNFKMYAGRDIYLNNAQISASTIKGYSRRDLQLDNSTKLKAKTEIKLESVGSIRVENSSQLLALSLTDPLSISLEAQNGHITINSANIVDANQVLMKTHGGNISINNSFIGADVIKAGVFSPAGELLISNSTLGGRGTAAASLINLFSEGSAGVRFSGTTSLNGNTVNIAGQTVTIDAGGQVRLLNPGGTTVYRDNANYNNAGQGNFTNSGGTPVSVNGQPFSGRPSF